MIRNVNFVQVLISIIFISVILSSCQEESEDFRSKGYLQLGIQKKVSANARIKTHDPYAILITIKDNEGNIINNLKKIPLIQVGDQYITEMLEFVEGEFSIEDFIVVDSNDSAIFITPKANSDFADMVEMPLPYNFTISGKQTSDLILEVIPANLGNAIQYGYATISFNVVNPLERGLVAYYPFDGNANDLGENELHAEVEGVTLATDRMGNANQAYFLDGIDDKISGKTNNMNIGDELSISCWIKTTDSTMPHIVSKYDWTQDQGYALRLIEGVPYIDGRDGNGQFIRCGDESAKVNDGQWHHLTATVKKNEWTLFLDGEIVHKLYTSSQNVDFHTSLPLSIGYYFQGNEGDYRHFNGVIDEVRIYNRTLTLYEISKLAGETI